MLTRIRRRGRRIKREKLPHLHKRIHDEFDTTEKVDDELIAAALWLGLATDPTSAAHLLHKNDLSDFESVITFHRAQRKKPPFWQRLMAFMRRIEGSWDDDPHKWEYWELRNRGD